MTIALLIALAGSLAAMAVIVRRLEQRCCEASGAGPSFSRWPASAAHCPFRPIN